MAHLILPASVCSVHGMLNAMTMHWRDGAAGGGAAAVE
jgi:hypothetical protein